jgi:hypothetical protein
MRENNKMGAGALSVDSCASDKMKSSGYENKNNGYRVLAVSKNIITGDCLPKCLMIDTR